MPPSDSYANAPAWSWSLDWLNNVDPNVLSIYPIQLANCMRLEKNPAVCLFDEVGSGKTISSGLMALHLLYHLWQEQKDCWDAGKKRVLVVTTSSLAKPLDGCPQGQFLEDWMTRLPFNKLGFQEQVDVTNNHCSHFREPNHYDLVIIDEAQTFLNREMHLYQNFLENVRADRVVFLSATPIKSENFADLGVYQKLARDITGNQEALQNLGWLSTLGSAKEEQICCTFDPTSPVSRYFKHTIQALTTDDAVKTCPERAPAEIIPFDYIGTPGTGPSDKKERMEALADFLNGKLDENAGNRFVIFVRYVHRDAQALGVYLESQGFQDFQNDPAQSRTYKVVTGENRWELGRFQGEEETPNQRLPHVLILTYQIAEQGINLPGYNYVINYHISKFPSALEQRFGRIDRMGGQDEGKVIHCCYLLGNGTLDTSTRNFHQAFLTYAWSILGALPSRNALLTTEMIDRLLQDAAALDQVTGQVKKALKDDDSWKSLTDLLKLDQTIQDLRDRADPGDDAAEELEKKQKELEQKLEQKVEQADETVLSLRDLIHEEGLNPQDQNELSKQVTAALQKAYALNPDEQTRLQFCKQFLEKVGNFVFYKVQPENFRGKDTFDFSDCCESLSLEDCTEAVKASSVYEAFKSDLLCAYPLPFLRQFLAGSQFLSHWEDFFETAFQENNFQKLFPLEGMETCYGQQLLADIRKVLAPSGDWFANPQLRAMFPDQSSEKIQNFFLQHTETIFQDLPFFKLCRLFQEQLLDIRTQLGFFRERLDNPYIYKFLRLKNKVWNIGLTEGFWNRYWGSKSVLSSLFTIVPAGNGFLHVPEWLKLVYHFTRPEAAVLKGFYSRYGSCRWTPCELVSESVNPWNQFEAITRDYAQAQNDEQRKAFCQRVLSFLTDQLHTYQNNWRSEFERSVLVCQWKQFQSTSVDIPVSDIINYGQTPLIDRWIYPNSTSAVYQYVAAWYHGCCHEMSCQKDTLESTADIIRPTSEEVLQLLFSTETLQNFFDKGTHAEPHFSKWPLTISLFQQYTIGGNAYRNFRSHCKENYKIAFCGEPDQPDYWSLGLLYEIRRCKRCKNSPPCMPNSLLKEFLRQDSKRPLRYLPTQEARTRFLRDLNDLQGLQDLLGFSDACET